MKISIAYLPFLFIISTFLLTISPPHAESSTVDDADSSDFESFHDDEDSSTSIINHLFGENDKSKASVNVKKETLSNQGTTYTANATYSLAPQLFDINTVTLALHKQMLKQCPNGWRKISEWSKPGDHTQATLSYQYSCL